MRKTFNAWYSTEEQFRKGFFYKIYTSAGSLSRPAKTEFLFESGSGKFYLKDVTDVRMVRRKPSYLVFSLVIASCLMALIVGKKPVYLIIPLLMLSPALLYQLTFLFARWIRVTYRENGEEKRGYFFDGAWKGWRGIFRNALLPKELGVI